MVTLENKGEQRGIMVHKTTLFNSTKSKSTLIVENDDENNDEQ